MAEGAKLTIRAKQGIPMTPDPELASAAESLVRRARQGDQNAMGMIVMVRQSASQGSQKAQKSYAALKRYISENPMSESISMGGEISLTPHAIQMANFPPFSRPVLDMVTGKVMGHAIPPGFGSERDTKMARALQLLRMPGSRISLFSPGAGWELGE